jgi:hypothetical protein
MRRPPSGPKIIAGASPPSTDFAQDSANRREIGLARPARFGTLVAPANQEAHNMTQQQQTSGGHAPPAHGQPPAHGPTKTTDHDTIRRWAEARAGFPVHTLAPLARDDPRSLRIRLPGLRTRPRVEPIQWREWFERFDEQQFAFVFEEKTDDGRASTTGKLVRRRRER